jgi:hypothetical protein
MDLLHNETGNFTASDSKFNQQTKELAFHLKDNYNKKDEMLTSTKTLFSTFQHDEHVVISAPTRQPRKRLCSSFDTLFYVGLGNSFDLRQRFLNELSLETKRKRGVSANSNTVQVDLKQAWLDSINGRQGNYDSPMYKKVRSLKMKLLQFHEDVRPAYYGTWSKAVNGRNIVSGRRPFAKDKEVLNYDYDSEAEWDHDVDGDDIHTLDPEEDDDERLFPDSSDEEDDDERDADEHEMANVSHSHLINMHIFNVSLYLLE